MWKEARDLVIGSVLFVCGASVCCVAVDAACPPGEVRADAEVGADCVTHDEQCCRCLAGLDCLRGQPTSDQCLAHIDDPRWLPVALADQRCMTDSDECASWCSR